MKVLLAWMIALTGVIVTADLAAANSATPPASLGYDISFPQCASNLPVSAGFGIVGVNDGHPFSANPCLASELRWATHTLTASPEFYANVDNPGPGNNANWPIRQQIPRVCFGANSVACSYDYGWNAARGSFHNVVVAESQNGAPSPSMTASQAHWWLDVESGNAWETIRTATGPTSAAFANDDAVLQGELAYFASAGVTSVGVYSTMSQWLGLMGVTKSSFASTKAWMTGYATLATAQAACTSAIGSFTGGRVAMIQYPSNGLDGDYQCPLLTSPTSSSVSVALSGTFTTQLAVAGESAQVAYAQSTGSPNLNVSSTGLLTTSGPLVAGTYTATGTTNANGDSGTFTFSLAVGSLTQNLPASASVSVATAATFTDQLAVTGANGAVTYVQTSGAPALVVSPTGLITTSGTLTSGTYVVQGTMSDVSGDQGTFVFTLKVGVITQKLPTWVSATPVTSATFTHQLAVTGASGAVTFVQTSGAPAMVVSPTGLITTSGSLAVGSYVVRGTTSDASGDTGRFIFNLRVKPAGTITQSPPTQAVATSVSVATAATFTDQLAVTGANGAVTFVQTSGAPAMVVSPTGLITTSGTLTSGTYVVQGTMSDVSGDQGTFVFNLRVKAPKSTPVGVSPTARRVIGYAIAGQTRMLRIIGSGFSGRPTVRSHAGTTAVVARHSETMLTLRVKVKSGSRRGTFAFVVSLANGKSCRVRYVQR
ncbi:MAG TPA: hypothetical protein VMV96_04785 [Acidimicrobiales bacterium]|nr:hypothetical protein [Acidimicrobiales bacterium]